MTTSLDWGGARLGNGHKPSQLKTADPEDVQGVSPRPPRDLPPEQRDFWRTYAKHAIEKRTLTRHTIAAFRLLCEMDVERQATLATIEKDGRTVLVTKPTGESEIKAHPLTNAYGRLTKDVMTGLARFGLAPFGKAEPTIVPAKKANPWATVAQKV